MSETRLYVGNLSFQAMDMDLQEYFSPAGVLVSAKVVMDKLTGRSRGFAFVEFSSPAEAAEAVEMFHKEELRGRTVSVNIARPREDQPPMRSGGGRSEGR